MTLLEDLERNAEDKKPVEEDSLKTIIDDSEGRIEDSWNWDQTLSHPGSTLDPRRLLFLRECFIA